MAFKTKDEMLTTVMSGFDELIHETEELLVKKKKETSKKDKDCVKLETVIESCKRYKRKFTTRMRSLIMVLQNEKNFNNLREQKRTEMGGQQQSPVVKDERCSPTTAPRSTSSSARTRIGVAPDNRRGSKRKLEAEARPRNGSGSGRESANLRNNPVRGCRENRSGGIADAVALVQVQTTSGAHAYYSADNNDSGRRDFVGQDQQPKQARRTRSVYRIPDDERRMVLVVVMELCEKFGTGVVLDEFITKGEGFDRLYKGKNLRDIIQSRVDHFTDTSAAAYKTIFQQFAYAGRKFEEIFPRDHSEFEAKSLKMLTSIGKMYFNSKERRGTPLARNSSNWFQKKWEFEQKNKNNLY